MTTETTALPSSPAKSAASPALTAALAVAVIAAATLAGAWFFQLVLQILPCPLCLEQRYAYYFAVPFAALLALAAARGAPRRVLIAGLAILAVAVSANAVLGTYHAGVEWQFWAGPKACTGSAFQISGALDLNAHVVSCDHAAWRLFGISMAGYNALISLGAAAFGFALLAKTERQA